MGHLIRTQGTTARLAVNAAQTPLDAKLHVGSGIYLVYSEHISAIPIEKGETQ